VQAEARRIGATRFVFAPAIFRLNLKPHAPDSIPRSGTGGNATLHRSAVQFGKQGLVLEQRIRFIRISLRTQASPLKQSGNPTDNALHHPRHFRIGTIAPRDIFVTGFISPSLTANVADFFHVQSRSSA
jgi:hypothetical protein